MLVFCYDYFSFHVSYLFHHFFLCWICVQISKKTKINLSATVKVKKQFTQALIECFFFVMKLTLDMIKKKDSFSFVYLIN